jgi:hypothetical protein
MNAQSTGDPTYVVYTSIFGDYDSLHDPRVPSPQVRFICFTDSSEVRSKAWEVVRVAPDRNSTDMNRRVKINPHLYLPPHDYSLYIDGNVRILGPLEGLFEKYSRITEIAAPRHPARDCLYDEAEVCMRNGRGDPAKILGIVSSYRLAGFPIGAGLFEFHMLFRRTFAPSVVRLMETWWSEYERGAGRDQITFPYAAWRCGTEITALEESPRYSRKLFRLGYHNAELGLPPLRKALLYARLNRHNSRACRVLADVADRLATSPTD